MEEARPVLHNKQAFIEALKNYQVSDRARSVLANTAFVALSGVAGGGRNTVIDKLVETGEYVFAVSDTTRPPKFRDGKMEQHGVNYYFRTEPDMLHDIEAGEFVEAEVIHNQQVSGISIREIERVMATGKIPIRDFEYGGIRNVVLAKPDATVIGLLPPSYEEWKRRLFGREELHEQEFINRLVTAEKVLENMLSQPYFKLVINDKLEECVMQIRRIVEQDSYPDEDDAVARYIATALLEGVRSELSRLSPANN
jgi:guanylate kinase